MLCIDQNWFAMSWSRFPNCRIVIRKSGWFGVKLPGNALIVLIVH